MGFILLIQVLRGKLMQTGIEYIGKFFGRTIKQRYLWENCNDFRHHLSFCASLSTSPFFITQSSRRKNWAALASFAAASPLGCSKKAPYWLAHALSLVEHEGPLFIETQPAALHIRQLLP